MKVFIEIKVVSEADDGKILNEDLQKIQFITLNRGDAIGEVFRHVDGFKKTIRDHNEAIWRRYHIGLREK